jgi:pSer/pThr/pTyr-binding forkhead associated (FHA) protein
VEFVLVRVQSDGGTTSAAVDRSKTVVGRQTGCHLRIRSGEVSREHCEILFDEGSAVVKDLGSRNGTYVNGVKVVEKRLEAGDLIAIGPVVFLVQLDGEPADFDAAELYREGMPGAKESEEEAAAPQAASDQAPTTTGGLMEGIEGGSSEDSSVVEFDFDFNDEEEEQDSQPPL